MLKELTREIHSNFYRSASARARYLHSLYEKSGFSFKGADYLDIGSGSGENSVEFGKNFSKPITMDLKNKNACIRGNALQMPFKQETFELVSMFSAIEHVQDKEKALREANRILKKGGLIVIQVPNRHFPVDLHNGLPFFHMLPKKQKEFFLKRLGYSEHASIDIPSKSSVKKMLARTGYAVVWQASASYPSECIPQRYRKIHRILSKTGFFTLLPMGYFFVAKKVV